MSQYPRTILTGTWVTWDGVQRYVRPGTVVDIQPGSALEAAYGGPSNLSAVITGQAVSPEAAPCLSKEMLANLAAGLRVFCFQPLLASTQLPDAGSRTISHIAMW